MRIGVLEFWQEAVDRPSYFLKRSVAEDLVGRGFAVWAVPRRVIKKLNNERLPIRPRAPRQLGIRVSKW
jgi:HEAT repeat protein